MVNPVLKDIVVGSMFGDRNAQLFTCGKCEAEYFFIFQVKGHNHQHYQCIGCGESYCSKGTECHDTQATNQ